MAEAEYIRPTVDASTGVSEGLNIFERLQRLKQVEAEGKRAAEQHLTNKLLDATEIKIRNLKVSEAEDARVRRATAVNAWSTSRGEFDTGLAKSLEELKDDPIKRQTALLGLKARFTSVSTYHPEAGAYIENTLAPHLANADMQYAEKVRIGDIETFDTPEQLTAAYPGYKGKRIFNQYTGVPFWVRTEQLDQNVVGPLTTQIGIAESNEDLMKIVTDPKNAVLMGIPAVSNLVTKRQNALLDAGLRAAKLALEERKTVVSEKTADATVESKKGTQELKGRERQEALRENAAKVDLIDQFTDPSRPDYIDLDGVVGPLDATIGMVSEEQRDNVNRLNRTANLEVLKLTKFLRPISEDELKFLMKQIPSVKWNSKKEWTTWLLALKKSLQPPDDEAQSEEPKGTYTADSVREKLKNLNK